MRLRITVLNFLSVKCFKMTAHTDLLIQKIEKKLGRDILVAERKLFAVWREALAYNETLINDPKKLDGEKVLSFKFKEVASYADYTAQCDRLEEDPDAMIVRVHALISAELQRLFSDSVWVGFDDEVDMTLVRVLEKTYG